MKKKVIVIGAGAAGLTAAISAARSGAEVTILEAQERPGRKLLVTGNGRCNLTNTDRGIHERYCGTGSSLASLLLKQFSASDTLAFFHELGLFTQEKNEYVYPYTSQASSVLEVLLAELRRLRVKLKFSVTVTEIVDHSKYTGISQKKPDALKKSRAKPDSSACAFDQEEQSPQYSIVTPTWTYEADAVILACGSKAAPSTGASETGYALAQALGHSIIRPRPVLVPFTCQSSFPEQRLAGVRCRAKVSLLRHHSIHAPANAPAIAENQVSFVSHKESSQMQCGNKAYERITSDIGELQWTKYGVSGIVIFQLSRFTEFSFTESGKQNRYLLSIDFLPDYTEAEIEEMLRQRAEDLGRESVSVLLRGMLHEKLIPVILKRAGEACGGYAPKFCSELWNHKNFIPGLAAVIKAYLLPITGTKSFEQAQVCAGGVDGREVSVHLESRFHRNLYFAGELMDVDGPCGGYNLQWAWTSGYLAGQNAAAIRKDL
ncbi:MAG: NAD(P)/FAD-dependent oxidoreductase [Lachnospiraceae bacterium]|nr:NAD(P)/FAD-dependent oxidoreductase [Lachnospiraceae bacterium]